MAVIFSCLNMMTQLRNHESVKGFALSNGPFVKSIKISSLTYPSSHFAIKALQDDLEQFPRELQPKRSVTAPSKPGIDNFKEPEAEKQSLKFVEAKKSSKEKVVTQTSMDYQQVLKYPIVTEAAIKLITLENTLTFMVDVRADKKDIRNAFENMLKIKTKKINTLINYDGTKKAYIQLSSDNQAATVAKKLKILG
uniref:60S ribosomal protein L23a-like n=1 Tax=Erigeron canadensis TaxID=72917 RepID=UPI001CB9592E|nr:60S ribosomal protein L23a-like [Erigeron canadensis]